MATRYTNLSVSSCSKARPAPGVLFCSLPTVEHSELSRHLVIPLADNSTSRLHKRCCDSDSWQSRMLPVRLPIAIGADSLVGGGVALVRAKSLSVRAVALA